MKDTHDSTSKILNQLTPHQNNSSEVENNCSHKTITSFVWGQKWEPSADTLNQYKLEKEDYDAYVAEYRRTHNGENLPSPKCSLRVRMLHDESVSEEQSNTNSMYRTPQTL
jgi:hypothetical protein